jgi:cyclopropane fatty-acyl-phospholipid synthase-like methyltransferase
MNAPHATSRPVLKEASPDLLSIARLVPQGARVLDLGCGTGELLAHLIRERGCSGYGVELDDTNVQAGVAALT